MRRVVPLLPFVGVLAVAAVVGSITCAVVAHCLRPAASTGPTGLHEMIHRQLHLTADQEARLEPIEARFAEKRRHDTELIRLANQELAGAITEDKADSPRVRTAVEHIHAAMADLQEATLDHVFEMRGVLTPEQYETLLRLTTDGLRAQP